MPFNDAGIIPLTKKPPSFLGVILTVVGSPFTATFIVFGRVFAEAKTEKAEPSATFELSA